MKVSPIVIIGTGLAGYMLAKEFRKLDQTTPLTMITASDGTFYSKPLLSTSLTAKRDIQKIATADVASMAKTLDADIQILTTVTKINVEAKLVETLSGNFPYQKIVIATGATVIRPPLLGDAVGDILSVNDLEDYARFCDLIKGKHKVAILGAGLVGCEFANDLANTGHEVHLIDPACYPLQRLLPEKIGRTLEKSLAESGVHWHFGQLISEINRSDTGYALKLSQSNPLEAEVVMSAIGLRPNIELAESSLIKTNYGIMVDRFLKTSQPNIYALGDCAEVSGMVLFFVTPLLQCAKALAQTLAGALTEVVYPVMPIVLKTPSCPIVIVPPPRNLLGEWEVEGEEKDLKALYHDQEGNLCGFALMGKAVLQKNQLMEKMSPLFS